MRSSGGFRGSRRCSNVTSEQRDGKRFVGQTGQLKAVSLVSILLGSGAFWAVHDTDVVVAYGLLGASLGVGLLVGGFTAGIEYATEPSVGAD
ncbi:hypothetical protein [Halorientalis sp.]|uniref:hypothetical protein n=1 Tax=Halorientalis sp. TaxID=1931229 RepID=UPI00261F14DE|nr:hypothetical protein [Halorientalis sp.]